MKNGQVVRTCLIFSQYGAKMTRQITSCLHTSEGILIERVKVELLTQFTKRQFICLLSTWRCLLSPSQKLHVYVKSYFESMQTYIQSFLLLCAVWFNLWRSFHNFENLFENFRRCSTFSNTPNTARRTLFGWILRRFPWPKFSAGRSILVSFEFQLMFQSPSADAVNLNSLHLDTFYLLQIHAFSTPHSLWTLKFLLRCSYQLARNMHLGAE